MSKPILERAGWKAQRLGDLCDFSSGLWKGKQPPFKNVGVIRNTNFNADGTLNDSDIAYLDVEDRQFAKRTLRFGDIILEKSGGGPKQPVGRVILFDKHEGEYSFSNFTACVRSKNPKVLNPVYLHRYLYWFYDAGVTESMQSHSTGIRNLNLKSYKDLAISYPSIQEQERIVAILDEAFEGIATARSNIETTCTKANELLDIKLQTLLTPSAEGWKSLTLAEVASDYGRGKSKHRPRNDPKLYGGIYPFVQTGDVRNAHRYITTYSQTYNDVGLSQSKLWPKGTLCVTIAANIAETAILDFEACFPDSVIGVVSNPSKANTRFIEYQLRVAKAQLQAKGKGSAQDNINLATFETHPFSFPSLSVQEVLVERLDSIALLSESLTDVLKQKLLLLDELKHSILRQAFSGNL